MRGGSGCRSSTRWWRTSTRVRPLGRLPAVMRCVFSQRSGAAADARVTVSVLTSVTGAASTAKLLVQWQLAGRFAQPDDSLAHGAHNTCQGMTSRRTSVRGTVSVEEQFLDSANTCLRPNDYIKAARRRAGRSASTQRAPPPQKGCFPLQA